jgi:hypothetical protein
MVIIKKVEDVVNKIVKKFEILENGFSLVLRLRNGLSFRRVFEGSSDSICSKSTV